MRLTGIIQLWLTLHFANVNNLKEAAALGDLWDPDQEVSNILIAPLELWKPAVTEQKPALIIKRQTLKFVRYGIDNRTMGGGHVESTQRNYMAGFSGSHTVFCMSGESGECEALAAEVSQEILQFAPIVREWLNFDRIELVDIGELSKLEEATENFLVPVNIAYAFREAWNIAPLDSPIVQGIQLILGPQ